MSYNSSSKSILSAHKSVLDSSSSSSSSTVTVPPSPVSSHSSDSTPFSADSCEQCFRLFSSTLPPEPLGCCSVVWCLVCSATKRAYHRCINGPIVANQAAVRAKRKKSTGTQLNGETQSTESRSTSNSSSSSSNQSDLSSSSASTTSSATPSSSPVNTKINIPTATTVPVSSTTPSLYVAPVPYIVCSIHPHKLKERWCDKCKVMTCDNCHASVYSDHYNHENRLLDDEYTERKLILQKFLKSDLKDMQQPETNGMTKQEQIEYHTNNADEFLKGNKKEIKKYEDIS
jgi:hypothetical protein